MKKLFSLMVTIAIIATIALLPAEGYSKNKWMLYDDFKSGIDPDRWTEPPDIVTIENEEVKFHFEEETPSGRYFLLINMEPKELKQIKGIRVTVRVEGTQAGVGDIVGGIAAMIGKWPNIEDEDLYVSDELFIIAGYRTIFCDLPVLYFDDEGQPHGLFNIFYGRFGEFPTDYLIGENFTITMIFSEDKMTYEVSGYGTIIRTLNTILDPSDTRYSRGLHTVKGFGTADVYFDDVYILK